MNIARHVESFLAFGLDNPTKKSIDAEKRRKRTVKRRRCSQEVSEHDESKNRYKTRGKKSSKQRDRVISKALISSSESDSDEKKSVNQNQSHLESENIQRVILGIKSSDEDEMWIKRPPAKRVRRRLISFSDSDNSKEEESVKEISKSPQQSNLELNQTQYQSVSESCLISVTDEICSTNSEYTRTMSHWSEPGTTSNAPHFSAAATCSSYLVDRPTRRSIFRPSSKLNYTAEKRYNSASRVDSILRRNIFPRSRFMASCTF